MGCRCGQNRRSQPAGAATYSPPPEMGQVRGMPAGVTMEAMTAQAPPMWYRVDVPSADGGVDSVWWSTQEDALAFAGGQYAVTRTRTPPPVPAG